jgi:hypothetical protein
MISAGSVGTFCSKITVPAASTIHIDVAFTDTDDRDLGQRNIKFLRGQGLKTGELAPLLGLLADVAYPPLDGVSRRLRLTL